MWALRSSRTVTRADLERVLVSQKLRLLETGQGRETETEGGGHQWLTAKEK